MKYFERIAAFWDSGWFEQLSKLEVGLWFAYAKFADEDGYAHPPIDRLAKMLGADADHLRRVRRRLTELGLLRRMAGGYKGTAAQFQLAVPEAPKVGAQGARL